MGKNRNKFKNIKKSTTEKFAITFLTLSIILSIVGAIPFLSIIALMMYYLIVVLIIAGTLFLILLNKDFVNKLNLGAQAISNIAEFFKYLPYILSVASVFSIVSIILYASAKSIDNKGVKVIAGVVFSIIPIVLIFLLKYI